MSGGYAFILDEDQRFASRCNMDMVALEQLELTEDIDLVKRLISEHAQLTGSATARGLLEDWDNQLTRFVKVFPHEYRRVLNERKAEEQAETARLQSAQRRR
jgi:glutamate synthase domain-containing protein 3